jgi:hypothetical protein
MSKPLENGAHIKFILDPMHRRKKRDNGIVPNQISSEVPDTISTHILVVSNKELTVSEYKSDNGLAVIQCHGGSSKSGSYWYTYTSKGEFMEFDIISLSVLVNASYYPVHKNSFQK